MNKNQVHAGGKLELNKSRAHQEELIKALGELELNFKKQISEESNILKRFQLQLQMEWELLKKKRAINKDDSLFIKSKLSGNVFY